MSWTLFFQIIILVVLGGIFLFVGVESWIRAWRQR